MRVYECTLSEDIIVGRLDVDAGDAMPPDAVKETIFGMVLSQFKAAGMMMVARRPSDNYVELLLKPEVLKKCSAVYLSAKQGISNKLPPVVGKLEDDQESVWHGPGDPLPLLTPVTIPKGTVLLHAPDQKSPAAVKSFEGTPTSTHRVTYWALRPYECFLRYESLMESKQKDYDRREKKRRPAAAP